VYRYERAGVLHGLMRVRGFTQDDAHHFVQQDRMEEELVWLLEFCTGLLAVFGFTDYDLFLSTRPVKSIGLREDWDRAEEGLKKALELSGLKYTLNEGDGAFYGPKIDLMIRDAIGRSWQCGTIQFDFSLPERFDLSYVDKDGQQKRPIMIHRALLGSIERFFGVLIEHYAGDLPLWLAPEQVRVLPITDAQIPYAEEIVATLRSKKIRAGIDHRSDKVNGKIRDAEVMKVPYMFVIGGREAAAQSVAVRKHGKGDLGVTPLPDAISMIEKEIESRALHGAAS
jgi:threonyl-tRNA synthetase